VDGRHDTSSLRPLRIGEEKEESNHSCIVMACPYGRQSHTNSRVTILDKIGPTDIRRKSLPLETSAVWGIYVLQEGQHPLTGQRAANFRLLANQ